jgi:hypothetical protein
MYSAPSTTPATAPLAALHLWAANHALQRVHGWQGWWWLDELTFKPLMVTLLGIPGVTFWWTLANAIRRGSDHRP